MQTATSETEIKSRDLSLCVHHYTLRAPCPEGQGTLLQQLECGIFGRTAVAAGCAFVVNAHPRATALCPPRPPMEMSSVGHVASTGRRGSSSSVAQSPLSPTPAHPARVAVATTVTGSRMIAEGLSNRYSVAEFLSGASAPPDTDEPARVTAAALSPRRSSLPAAFPRAPTQRRGRGRKPYRQQPPSSSMNMSR